MAHRTAVVTAAATYILLLAGGLVHSTGAGLACPDWPLCYGMWLPPMVGNIRFEHSHRLIAGTVGILTLITSALVWFKERATLRPLVVAAVLAIVVQIILGGLTVIYRLPDLVSTAHLAVGTAFFALLVVLSVKTARGQDSSPSPEASACRAAIWTGIVLVYCQTILGAFVRHTESGGACPDLPYCHGTWLPPIQTPGGLHMLHRYGAVAAVAAVSWVFLACRRVEALRQWSAVALALCVTQVLAGMAAVLTKLSLGSVMVHLGLAMALILCLAVPAAKTS
ncbi:MAG: hypothetical protein A3G34_09875 [Candidatus Lindowbacteria bacterium RIFCSPLOWO2_12_FULL_62_27]|nr:MAG: hypothetical protein A3G34_09875 [Candidatus Lindowbacteria bacterium RIFCSPLOWO2_12_FULL_62_27]OGH61550.1 MAG: hypothetical protein A3I06_02880 [Candidatus Lindowbacteria bacterium RIFCSPLOWO2_02_FULL_62_12]